MRWKRKDADAVKSRTALLDGIVRESRAHEMSTGKATLPVAMSNYLSNDEKALFDDKFTPWFRVESESRCYYFGYSHYVRESDDVLKLVNRGKSVKGVCITVIDSDGKPWPEPDNQLFIESDASPFILESEQGMSFARELVIWLIKPKPANAQEGE